MFELILVIIGLLAISFLCSILESVLLSISRPFIQTLIDKQNASGVLLRRLKSRVDEPIAAILTLNTISHTVGAAVSGALAVEVFGSQWMGLFSAVLTLLILIISEIIPKTLGAQYWKGLAPMSAYTLRVLIFVLKPLIVPVNFLSRWLTKGNPGAMASKSEIYNAVRLGYRQGVLQSPEYKIMDNLFHLQEVRVRDIMTPRTVVFWLDPETSIRQLKKDRIRLEFSRIPLYQKHDNTLLGMVLRRDLMTSIAEGKLSLKLIDLVRDIEFLPDSVTVLYLINHLVRNKLHLVGVLNEYGDYIGIVTLEDAMETLIGAEIVDEFDTVEDMQKLAQNSRKKSLAKASRFKKNDGTQ